MEPFVLSKPRYEAPISLFRLVSIIVGFGICLFKATLVVNVQHDIELNKSNLLLEYDGISLHLRMRNKKKKSNNARKSTPYRQWWRSSSSPPFSSPTSSQHDIAKPPAVNVSSKTNPQLTSRGTNYGIKVLYDGASEEIGVDIVLVHGLTGNAFNTWYHKDSDTHWPTKLLKQDIPEARILTFGYDANLERLHEPRTLSRLTNHAEELVDQLERLRRGESKNDNNTNTNPSSSFRQSSKLSSRKICFVAHSLGGLLTAQALSFSRRSAERHLQQIERCTVSVVFLGVPNCGSDWAKWANFASKLRWIIGGRSVRTELTNTLKPNSEMLILIQKNFQNLLRFREREGCGISLACLYEKKPIWNGKVVCETKCSISLGWETYRHLRMRFYSLRMDLTWTFFAGRYATVSEHSRVSFLRRRR